MAIAPLRHGEKLSTDSRSALANNGQQLPQPLREVIDAKLAESRLRRLKRAPQQNAAGGSVTTTQIIEVTETVSYTPGQPLPTADGSQAASPVPNNVAATSAANNSEAAPGLTGTPTTPAANTSSVRATVAPSSNGTSNRSTGVAAVPSSGTTAPPSSNSRAANGNNAAPSITDTGIKTFDTTSPTGTAAANTTENRTFPTAAMAAILAVIGALILFLVSFCLWKRSRRRLKASRLAAAGGRGTAGSGPHTDEMSLVNEHERFGSVGAPMAASGIMAADGHNRRSLQATGFQGPMDRHQMGPGDATAYHPNAHWVPPVPVPLHGHQDQRPHTPLNQVRADGRMYTPPPNMAWDDPTIGPGPTYPLNRPLLNGGTFLDSATNSDDQISVDPNQQNLTRMPMRVPIGSRSPNANTLEVPSPEIGTKRHSRRKSSIGAAAAAVAAVVAHGHRKSHDERRLGDDLHSGRNSTLSHHRHSHSHTGLSSALAVVAHGHQPHEAEIEQEMHYNGPRPRTLTPVPPPIPQDSLEPPTFVARKNSTKSAKSGISGKSARSMRDELDAANAKAAGRPWPAIDIDTRHSAPKPPVILGHKRHSSDSVTSQYPSYTGNFPPLKIPQTASGAVSPGGDTILPINNSRSPLSANRPPLSAMPGALAGNGTHHNRSLSHERHTRVEDFYAPWVKEMMKDGRYSYVAEEEVDSSGSEGQANLAGRKWRFPRPGGQGQGQGQGVTSDAVHPVWR